MRRRARSADCFLRRLNRSCSWPSASESVACVRWAIPKISVESAKRIDADFDGLFKTAPPPEPDYTGSVISPVYFEGFPEHRIFGYYDLDHSRWSASIGGDHALWTVIFTIMKALGAISPLRYHTRESHRAYLDAAYPKKDQT